MSWILTESENSLPTENTVPREKPLEGTQIAAGQQALADTATFHELKQITGHTLINL